MTSFEENLVVEVIGLIVGLFVTYLIIDQIIKKRREDLWEPAKKRLLATVKRNCEGAIVGWASHTIPPLIEPGTLTKTLSNAVIEQATAALERELDEFQEAGTNSIFSLRPTSYWKNQVRALSQLRESISLAIDRALIASGSDAELVQRLIDLEASYIPISGLQTQLQRLDDLAKNDAGLPQDVEKHAEDQLRIGAAVVSQFLHNAVQLRRSLHDVPGLIVEAK
ncbi:MAG TPA: hypothetical protein VMR52_09715 [Dehalococcoidia bacterium]|nr:hypothetical protein [Dehalococcoidia bacterium]